MLIRFAVSVSTLIVAAGLAAPVSAGDANPPPAPPVAAVQADPSAGGVAAPPVVDADQISVQPAVPSGPTPKARQPAAAPVAAPSPSAGESGDEGAASRGSPMDVFARRGGTLPPVVTYLIQQSVKLVSLGSDAGVKGYLGEAANGHYQAFYVSPDGQFMAVGMMFRAGGRNVTSSQVEGMMRRFQAAAKSEEGKASGVDAGTLKDIVTDGTASKDADVSIVDWYRSLGLTVTPFGDKEGGFEAFLVESKHDANTQGVMQAFYVMPDPRFAVAGFLSQRGGTNVTGLQIANMKMRAAEKARNDDGPKGSKVAPGVLSPSVPQVPVERIIEETSPLAKAPAEVSGAEALARKPAGAPPWQPAPADQGPQTGPVASQPAPQAAVRPELPELPLSTLSAAASDPYRSKIDKATFTEALKTSIWFQVGAPEAPMIYMIVDPQCPFCHATWQKIKPFVFARKLQVRIVMIAGLKGSYPLAVSILSRPGDGAASAWLSGEGSMHDVPVRQGPIPGSGDWDRVAKMLQINTHFIDRFAIDRTPFISYQSMDGTLYTSLGLPQDLNAFFAALQSR